MSSQTATTSKSKQSFADLLASSGGKIPSLRRGQEVQGKVVAVSKDELLVDIGAKSEGIVAGKELDMVRDIAGKLSVGDTIDVSILYPENDAGQVVLSLRKLSGEKRWAELEDKRENNEDLEVSALEVNRGGVICEWQGLRGFLPASQIAVGQATDGDSQNKLTDLIGRNLTVRIIEVDRGTNRLIFSQKSPDRRDLTHIAKLLSKIKIGDKLSGTVSAVLPFGVFVEVDIDKVTKVTNEPFDEPQGKPKEPKDEKTSGSPGSSDTSTTAKLEGLVHISEISWEKIDDPAKLFAVGDKIDVMVIAKDEATGRLNLSAKQLLDDPFLAASASYNKDQSVSGNVVRVTPYGVYITLENGVEGLIHISKIPPEVSYQLGQQVECTVDGVDTRGRHISLVPVVREKPVLYR